MKRATEVLCKTSAKLNISIHALVKRATSFHKEGVIYRQYFNPRPREEGDRAGGYINVKL